MTANLADYCVRPKTACTQDCDKGCRFDPKNLTIFQPPYREAARVRKALGTHKPRLLILGYARHGKDTVAEILRDDFGFAFVSSSMFLAEKVVVPYLAERGITYDSLEAAYEDRVNHRAAWHHAIAAYNENDPTLLAREILKVADIYVGMRSQREYEAVYALFDAVLWVSAEDRGLPPEPRSSMDISYELGRMHFINNSGTLADLHEEVRDTLRLVLANMEKVA